MSVVGGAEALLSQLRRVTFCQAFTWPGFLVRVCWSPLQTLGEQDERSKSGYILCT
jgi:hypothetical protein